MIITLVRHMQTNMNSTGTLQGTIDSELSEAGKEHCETFVKHTDLSHIEALYCSDKQRTKYLANKIQQVTNLTLHIDPRLNEINLGEWEGLTWPEVTIKYEAFLKTWFIDSANIRTPGGESYKDLQDRAMAVITEIADTNIDNVMIITHGAVIKTIVCSVLGLDLKQRSKLDIENGSITKIAVKNGKYRLLTLNQSCTK